MTGARIKKYLEDRGLAAINTNYEGISLYKLEQGQSVSLVMLVEKEGLDTLNSGKYNAMLAKIRDTFLRAHLTSNILTLFVSQDLAKVKEIAEGTAFWIVDAVYGRVVVYENQPEDYLSMKRDIEALISMLKADELRHETWDKSSAMRKEGAYKSYDEQWVPGSARGPAKPRVKRVRRRLKNYPFVTLSLIVVNLLMLILVDLLGTKLGTYKWEDAGAVSWMRVINNHEYYRLVTCMFFHGGIDHLFGNMITLYAAGEILEDNIGHFKFALIYFLGGIIASGGSVFYHYVNNLYVVSIGASGAVFAVTGGLFAVLFLNKNRVNRDFSQIGASRILLFIVYSLYSGFSSAGVDNAAHVAGLLGGILVYWIIYTFVDSKKDLRG